MVLGYMIQPDSFHDWPYTRSMAMAFRHIFSPYHTPFVLVSSVSHITYPFINILDRKSRISSLICNAVVLVATSVIPDLTTYDCV